jgi:hypothetical protein
MSSDVGVGRNGKGNGVMRTLLPDLNGAEAPPGGATGGGGRWDLGEGGDAKAALKVWCGGWEKVGVWQEQRVFYFVVAVLCAQGA